MTDTDLERAGRAIESSATIIELERKVERLIKLVGQVIGWTWAAAHDKASAGQHIGRDDLLELMEHILRDIPDMALALEPVDIMSEEFLYDARTPKGEYCFESCEASGCKLPCSFAERQGVSDG